MASLHQIHLKKVENLQLQKWQQLLLQQPQLRQRRQQQQPAAAYLATVFMEEFALSLRDRLQ
jgi:hypothetical protein